MENYTFPAEKDIFQPFVQSNNSKTAELWSHRLGHVVHAVLNEAFRVFKVKKKKGLKRSASDEPEKRGCEHAPWAEPTTVPGA